jgi:hypothetical protein
VDSVSASEFKLIMLDQNAISNLALKPNKEWSEILDLLRYGVNRGRILCPVDVLTIAETSHLPINERKLIENLGEELACGHYVKPFFELIAQEILATVRPDMDTFPLWLPTNKKAATEDENLKGTNAILKEKEEIETWFKTLEFPEKDRSFTVAEAQRIAVSNWFSLMRGYLNKFRNGQLIGDEQFVIQQILAKLNDYSVTDKEITGLLRGIQEESWLRIPIILCWLLLDGLLLYDAFQRGRKLEYNDETDKFRAATAYHFAHGFITDRGMAASLRQLKFEDPEYFSVFSVPETQKIITFLKSVC